jgi:thiol-disulfide isomerase/thioredoxin
MTGRGTGTVLFIAAWVLLAASGPAPAQEKEGPPPGESPGVIEKVSLLAVVVAAPGFRLADVAGPPFSYGEKGSRKPLLIAFFSIFCEPCRIQLPVLQRMQEKYGGGGLEVAAVSLDGEVLKTTVAGFTQQERYTFRVLLDQVRGERLFRVADAYRVTEIPALYLMDRAGRVAFAGTGRVTEESLEKAVSAVLRK